MNTCIEVKNLTKSFNKRVVVDGINFRVEKEEVFGLLGHNGQEKVQRLICFLDLRSRIAVQEQSLDSIHGQIVRQYSNG